MTVKSIQSLVNSAMQEIKTITANEAYKMLEDNNCNLIDIREPHELDVSGTIENSINIPRSHLEFQFEVMVQNGVIDPNKETVLFCAAGGRSALTTKTLQEMGCKKVCHIQGGFSALQNSKFKVTK